MGAVDEVSVEAAKAALCVPMFPATAAVPVVVPVAEPAAAAAAAVAADCCCARLLA